MSIDAERLEMIRANAAFVIKELGALSSAPFGLDAASVAWTEGFIERQRDGLAEGTSEGLANVLGCYLGEAIIAAVPDARWHEDADGTLGIAFANGDMAYPFNKVGKQLKDGLEGAESILSFYNISVDYVAAGKLGKSATGEGP